MSALPAPLHRGAPRRTEHEAPVRHIEIAPTRDQRRARPRLLAALVTVGGLFAILAAQLLLTIATSEGAYEIASLQSAQNELSRDEQVLQEQIRVLEAPQHLAAEATAMGMVPNSGSAQLRLSDSAVLGTPSAALASSALLTAADGSPLIPNSLLADVPLVGATPLGTSPDGTAVFGTTLGGTPVDASGAPAATLADGSVASTPPVGIPTPTTH